jgi:hypothetical protein
MATQSTKPRSPRPQRRCVDWQAHELALSFAAKASICTDERMRQQPQNLARIFSSQAHGGGHMIDNVIVIPARRRAGAWLHRRVQLLTAVRHVVDALRPMLLCASSPYARRGAPALVWQAATREMNLTVPQRVIDQAIESDPASAAAEYGAQFRSDIESFVTREVVEAAVDPGMIERPPIAGERYVAFVDPSGGSSDSMTVAIAHVQERVLTLDALREHRPPFSPEAVVAEFTDLLKRYGVSTPKRIRCCDYCGDSMYQERRPGAAHFWALVSRMAEVQARSNPRFPRLGNLASASLRTTVLDLGQPGFSFIIPASHRRHWFSAPIVVDGTRVGASEDAGHLCRTSSRLSLRLNKRCSESVKLEHNGNIRISPFLSSTTSS